MTGRANIDASAETEQHNGYASEKTVFDALARCVRRLADERSALKKENRRLADELAAATRELQQLRDAATDGSEIDRQRGAEQTHTEEPTNLRLSMPERLVLRERLLRLLEKIDLELHRYNS
jgi:predicted RNase H-like nuclease (RuvC/YqgF family)